MRFSYHDLGPQHAQSTVRVTLRGSSANVLLLDTPNFARYQAGEPFVYSGGFQRRTPVELTIPEDGHWYVVLDLGGYKGKVRGHVEVVSPDGAKVGASI